jgi:hypothetical protein
MTYLNTYSGKKSQSCSAIRRWLAEVVEVRSLIIAAGSRWLVRDVNYMRNPFVMNVMAKDLVAKAQ